MNKEKKDLEKFKELMQEVAKLNERDREKVSIYAQGVMAAASTSKEKSAQEVVKSEEMEELKKIWEEAQDRTYPPAEGGALSHGCVVLPHFIYF